MARRALALLDADDADDEEDEDVGSLVLIPPDAVDDVEGVVDVVVVDVVVVDGVVVAVAGDDENGVVGAGSAKSWDTVGLAYRRPPCHDEHREKLLDASMRYHLHDENWHSGEGPNDHGVH